MPNCPKKICLLSITASHYRARVYQEIDEKLCCDFIFGEDTSTVKRMDTSLLRKSINLPNIHLGSTQWYYQPGLLKNIKKYNVIINDLGIYCLSSWVVIILSKFTKRKVYNWDHGWYGKENNVKKWIKKIYFGLVDGSFIYGDNAIRLMKENGFNGDKLFPIHNSLDYQSQFELRRNIQTSCIYYTHFGNEYPVLIMIGRLNMRKSLHILIDAIAWLKTKGKLYNIVLVGDGEDRKRIEDLVSMRNVGNQVWFYGACYDEGINAELIYNADMCVVPGDIGLTAIHAMMFGTPVVTHDCFPNHGPEYEAVREGITGSFFKYNDMESLATVIENWFEKQKGKRRIVREACYKEIDNNWTPEYQIKVIKKVIYG